MTYSELDQFVAKIMWIFAIFDIGFFCGILFAYLQRKYPAMFSN